MGTSPKSIWEAIKAAGFTKLGFIGAAIAAWFFGLGGFFVGGFVFLAVYVNINPIWKYLMQLWTKGV
jgi:hypothetical protein